MSSTSNTAVKKDLKKKTAPVVKEIQLKKSQTRELTDMIVEKIREYLKAKKK